MVDNNEQTPELQRTGKVLAADAIAANAMLHHKSTLTEQWGSSEQDCIRQLQELETEAVLERTRRVQETKDRLRKETEAAVRVLEQQHASALTKRLKELQADFDRQVRKFEEEWVAKMMEMQRACSDIMIV